MPGRVYTQNMQNNMQSAKGLPNRASHGLVAKMPCFVAAAVEQMLRWHVMEAWRVSCLHPDTPQLNLHAQVIFFHFFSSEPHSRTSSHSGLWTAVTSVVPRAPRRANPSGNSGRATVSCEGVGRPQRKHIN